MTSDAESLSERHRALDKGNKPSERSKKTKPIKPCTPESTQAESQETLSRQKDEVQKETRSWWERVRPFVEVAGVVLLAIYTFYTIKIYNVTRKALIATSSAVFDCHAELQGGANGLVVACRNKGITPATAVSANLTFVRDENDKEVQVVKRELQRTAIPNDDEFAFVIPIPNAKLDWDWISKQAMTANLSFTYNNGVEVVPERDCWGLAVERKSHEWEVTDCQNAHALSKGNK